MSEDHNAALVRTWLAEMDFYTDRWAGEGGLPVVTHVQGVDIRPLLHALSGLRLQVAALAVLRGDGGGGPHA